jgi:NurA-like 5'-3' nuclease
MVSFSNKEKFGSRVFEGLRALMEDDSWKKMSDLDGIIENADTLKEYIAYLYILFDDFIEEYKKIANLSSIEDTGRTKKLLRDIIL